jgi:hypothetical protein
MNFVNSILLFFAFLLVGPAIVSNQPASSIQKISFSPTPKDPYEGTVLVRGGTFAMGLDEESILEIGIILSEE